ncbi:MAG: choice-of-anchor tandem repeat GloVer-containing protein [Verrucomicrobiota bacterium]
MKLNLHLWFVLAFVGLAATPEIRAQTFTTLYNFSATNYDVALGYPIIPDGPPTGMTNADGAEPVGTLILSGGTLYGTAFLGGTYAFGTLFAINTNGTGFTNLYNFTGGSDGDGPFSGLVLSGANLYGTAEGGGESEGEGGGTVFTINTNGTGFMPLHTFMLESSEGFYPGGLIFSGNTLYGTATSVSGGVIFTINTNSTAFSILFDLVGNDGGGPQDALILSGTNFYGTAYSGGLYGTGTAFKLSTNGKVFTLLHSFTQGTRTFPRSGPPIIKNSDGAAPYAGLVLSGNTLYGVTTTGGTSGNGVIFAVNTNATGFTNLYTFTPTDTNGFNNDGAEPESTLVLAGDTLYGTANAGGAMGYGTVFSIKTNGTSFTTLHSFNGASDGAQPFGGLTLCGNTLFGTTFIGGTNGNGTIFSVTLPPPLPVIAGLNLVANNLVIDGGAQIAGTYETLMSTNPFLPFNQWTPVATNILNAGGNFGVTNPIDPNLPQCFYVLQAK